MVDGPRQDRPGTQILTGSNGYTGGTTISGGTLEIGGAGVLGGGNYSTAISNNAALVFNSSSNQTLGGTITGSGSLAQLGPSLLTLAAANYTGNTTVNAGTLAISGGTLSPTGTLSVGNNATFAYGGSAGSATVAGGGALVVGYNGTGALTLPSLTFNGAATITLTPSASVVPIVVTGSNGLTASGGTGSVVINLGGTALPTGTYSLVDYAGTIGGTGPAAFVLGSTPLLGPRDGWTIVNNPGAPSLDLDVVTLHPVWTGAISNEWILNSVNNWTVGAPRTSCPTTS